MTKYVVQVKDCFSAVYKYLDDKYTIPHKWREWTIEDMDIFLSQNKQFLSRKDHIGFFRSFCSKVKDPKKDDIVLTRTSVGVVINQFTYWVYNEDLGRIEHLKLDDKCLIMRINNG